MNLRNSVLYFLVLIALVSCDKKRVFDEYKSVGNAWNKDSIVSFDLPEMDVKKQYNLFLIVSLEQPNKKTLVDTLEYQMANPDGSLLGDGFTDIKESKLVYKERVKFIPGTYKVHIKQAVRQTGKVTGVKELKGITDVGFRIEKIE